MKEGTRMLGWTHPALRLAALVVAGLLLARPAPAQRLRRQLPRFTETREAAVLFFVKKHVPEVLPLLEQLKKSSPTQYQEEVRAIFQVTELLASFQDTPRRHELELKIWITETKAHVLVAQLPALRGVERKRIEMQLQEMARELVEMDVQVLQVKIDQLDQERTILKEELEQAHDSLDRNVRARYEELISQARKPKK